MKDRFHVPLDILSAEILSLSLWFLLTTAFL